MKSVQNKALLALLLVSVAGAQAMETQVEGSFGNLQDLFEEQPVVATSRMSKIIEAVKASFVSAGSKVKSAAESTKNGAISAYNYVTGSTPAKYVAEKAVKTWNYSTPVTLRGKEYNLPVGKIGVGLAATVAAYFTYNYVANKRQANKVYAAQCAFYLCCYSAVC